MLSKKIILGSLFVLTTFTGIGVSASVAETPDIELEEMVVGYNLPDTIKYDLTFDNQNVYPTIDVLTSIDTLRTRYTYEGMNIFGSIEIPTDSSYTIPIYDWNENEYINTNIARIINREHIGVNPYPDAISGFEYAIFFDPYLMYDVNGYDPTYAPLATCVHYYDVVYIDPISMVKSPRYMMLAPWQVQINYNFSYYEDSTGEMISVSETFDYNENNFPYEYTVTGLGTVYAFDILPNEIYSDKITMIENLSVDISIYDMSGDNLVSYDYVSTIFIGFNVQASNYENLLRKRFFEENYIIIDDSINFDELSYTDWIINSIGSFMDFEIAPNFSIGGILGMVLLLCLTIWLLKVFLGG